MEQETTYREIESKFVVNSDGSQTLESVGLQVEATILWMNRPYKTIPRCETRDVYWTAPQTADLQFVRIRDSSGQGRDGEYRLLKEITVKQKDRGNNNDRLEINLNITSAADAQEIIQRLIGGNVTPSELIKKEMIYFVEDGAVISLARVHSHSQDIYLEVEAPSQALVQEYVDQLSTGLDLTPEPKSFYELFCNQGEVNV